MGTIEGQLGIGLIGCEPMTDPDIKSQVIKFFSPRLAGAPQGIALGDVLVSISHTRQWAYGLAVIHERTADRDPGCYTCSQRDG